MRRPFLTTTVLALSVAVGGCSTLMQDSKAPRPGLEVLANRPQQTDSAPTATSATAAPLVPVPPSPGLLPFPVGRLNDAEAERLLADDPMALRFLALKRLGQTGLLPPEDVIQRRIVNLGALLPLTAVEQPAVGLNRPIPPLADIMQRFSALYGQRSTAEEMAFLADALLPHAPERRSLLAPPDLIAARGLGNRLERLDDAGLITPDEHAREKEALDTLMGSGALPENANPPPSAPDTPPKEIKKTPKARSGARMPGGVSGRLEVIPSPPEVTAPKPSAASTEPVGLHLLSMGAANQGDKAWATLKKEHQELEPYGFTVSRADLGELGVTYRLIVGPMDKATADKLCETLRPRGQMCTPTDFPK